MRVHLQVLQIVAETARRQATVLGVSDTLSDLGWILFASCALAILMANLGNGRPARLSLLMVAGEAHPARVKLV
jgi:hypothetical protein